MKIEVGKEIEFAIHRLNDIEFFVRETQPVHSRFFRMADWEGYARDISKLIAEQAREAKAALSPLSNGDRQ